MPAKRPHGMRVATFERLKAEHAAQRERINRRMIEVLPKSLLLRLMMERDQ